MSIINLVRRLEDQVNPFDGGKTWSNPNPVQQVQPSAPDPRLQALSANTLIRGQGLPTQSNPTVTQGPNFVFSPQGIATHRNENWGIAAGAPPVPTPRVQNNIYQPYDGWGAYGDSSGNQWLENDGTGQRVPLQHPQGTIDQPIIPPQPFNRLMKASPLYLRQTNPTSEVT